jgi:hypothetical protein
MTGNPRKDRSRFLALIYKKSGGDMGRVFEIRDRGGELGFDEGTAFRVANYLAADGLITPRAIGGGVSISLGGIKAAEESRKWLGRWQPSNPIHWIILIVAGWVITSLLDIEKPALISAFLTILAAASATPANGIPLWEYRIITLFIAVPMLYIFYYLTWVGNPRRGNRKVGLLWAVSLSTFGIFGLGFLTDTLLGH